MFLPESVATHGKEYVEPQRERISVQWEPWHRQNKEQTTQVIKPVVCYKAAMPAWQILCCKASDQQRQLWCCVQQVES